MRPFHLFTVAGIPVNVSPFYLLLLFMFAHGDLVRGVIAGVGVTLVLLVHELGHALVARYLRHQPSIMLHGFGGLTSRQRQGRDVEEATIIAMGPAAGLALGLLVAGAWQLLISSGSGRVLVSAVVYESLHAVLVPCISWNLLNLLPLWPLDGGQLFRLGVMRLFGARRADLATHGLALALIAACFIFLPQTHSYFMVVLLGMLAVQNLRAMRGEESSGIVHTGHALASELLGNARKALAEERFREAARLTHQARASSQLPPPVLDEIWEILGLANTGLGEHEEALTYLRRAPPNERVRRATQVCLTALGSEDELPEIAQRWQASSRGRHMGRWLVVTLAFIAFAATVVFSSSLSRFVF